MVEAVEWDVWEANCSGRSNPALCIAFIIVEVCRKAYVSRLINPVAARPLCFRGRKWTTRLIGGVEMWESRHHTQLSGDATFEKRMYSSCLGRAASE